jgi:hypothetical protein
LTPHPTITVLHDASGELYLCGENAFTAKSFGHHHESIHNEPFELVDIFAFDLTDYDIQSSHLHVVLFIVRNTMGPHEVIER